MKFTKTASDPHSSARAGVIETDHGSIRTPIFMPVGTVGSVKGVWHRDLRDDIGAEIILGKIIFILFLLFFGSLAELFIFFTQLADFFLHLLADSCHLRIPLLQHFADIALLFRRGNRRTRRGDCRRGNAGSQILAAACCTILEDPEKLTAMWEEFRKRKASH